MLRPVLITTLLLFSCSHQVVVEDSSERNPATAMGQWRQWSGDILNHHNLTPERPVLAPTNVNKLKTKWTFTANSSVIATPTVADGTIYFNGIAKIGLSGLFTGGYLYAVHAQSGVELWSKKIEDYTGHGLRNFSRSSPAIYGNAVIIGDSINNIKFIAESLTSYKGLPGSSIMAINRKTGQLIWKTEVEKHFASRITMSPVVHGGRIYVGVSSLESEIPALRGQLYNCCSFKGSFVALDARTGKLLWKTSTISQSLKDFSGAPVWGSSPPIDVKRNRIYIATGNNYHTPKALKECYMAEIRKLSPNAAIKKCAGKFDSPENRFDSIIALDLGTGKIIWTKKTSIHDAWNVGCGSGFTAIPPRNERLCPKPEGLDSDFAQAPMLIKTDLNGVETDLLVVGQKNGAFWALNAEDGKTVWNHQVGPGGKLGGHQWGSATDGERIYFQTTNMEHNKVVMEVGLNKGKVIHGGFWGALDVKTGKLLWQTPDPATVHPLKGGKINHVLYGFNLGLGYFAAPMGALTYYNKMIFAGSLSGQMVALDAQTGRILWSKKTKGSIVSAPSVVDDVLYWGAGYHMGFEDNKVYALEL